MTDDERQERLAELNRWLTEICEALRDEASRLASEPTQTRRGADMIWQKLSSKLNVAEKVFTRLLKASPTFLDEKLRSKLDLSRYLKGAIRNETKVKAPQEQQRSADRREKLKQNAAVFQRETEDVQRDHARSAREIHEQHMEFCLKGLSDRDRRILIAVKRDGVTIEEVTRRETVGYDAMTEEDRKRAYDKIKTALKRARDTVRRCMIERGVKFGDLS